MSSLIFDGLSGVSNERVLRWNFFLSLGSDKAVVRLSKEKTLQTNPATLLYLYSIYCCLSFPVSIKNTAVDEGEISGNI